MRSTTAALSLAAALAVMLALLTGAAGTQPVQPTRAASLASRQTPTARDTTTAQPEVNLNGIYRGTLKVADQPEQSDATLIINGNRFTLKVNGLTQSGTLTAHEWPGQLVVSMRFGTETPAKIISLRAKRRGDRLSLTSAPGEPSSFTFTSDAGRPGVRSGNKSGAIHANNTSNTADFNTNTAGNTSANANVSANVATDPSEPCSDPPIITGGGGDPAPPSLLLPISAPPEPRRFEEFQPVATTAPPPPRGSAPPPGVRRTGRNPSATPVGNTASGAADNSPPDAGPQLPAQPTPNTSTPAPVGQNPIAVIVKNLPEGLLVLNAPDKMQQGVARTVTARISFEDIGDAIKAELPDAGTTTPEAIKVAEEMRVVLTPKEKDAFTIEPKNEEKQIIVGKSFAEWNWEVTPLRAGKQSLLLRASAIVYVPERGEKSYEVPTKNKDIEVEVSYGYIAKSFIREHKSELFGGLSIPCIIGLLWKVYQWWKSRGKGGQAQPSAS